MSENTSLSYEFVSTTEYLVASNGIQELRRVLCSGVLHCVPLYIGFSGACHVCLQGRECCGIQLQNMGTCVFSQWSSECMCHLVDVYYRVSEEHTAYIVILTVCRTWMLKWREERSLGYTGKLEGVWSEVVMSQWK
jgi:hypothetical protein